MCTSTYCKLFYLSVLLFFSPYARSQTISYLYPLPNSEYLSGATNIIIRLTAKSTFRNIPKIQSVAVYGSRSSLVSGEIYLSDDNQTYVFKPSHSFGAGERVAVSLSREKSEGLFPDTSFSFLIADSEPGNLKPVSDDVLPAVTGASCPSHPEMVIGGVAVPSDFPTLTIPINGQTDSGSIFINNWGGTPYLMILKNDGTPVFYRRMPSYARDFKVHKNGLLSYRLGDGTDSFFTMDSTYTVRDTFQVKNGFGTDEHEFQFLPNGHVLMIGLDYRTVNMSQLVTGGNPNANVVGNSVVELDLTRTPVFIWRSWDNYQITDAIGIDLTASFIDYVHMNAISVDNDGNLLVSARHLCEITKINRTTGKTMWRLGGGKKNQFTFTNDADKISWQHDIRSLPNGNYTLMDNGNQRFPNYSRAFEFTVDTTAKTVNRVWQYRNSPDYFTGWMGNVQRLPNGNTFICWADGSLPKVTEITPQGNKIYQMGFVDAYHCYRAFRFPWHGAAKLPYLLGEAHSTKITLIFNKFGDVPPVKYYIYAGKTPSPTTLLDSTSQTTIDLTALDNHANYYFRVRASDNTGALSAFSNEISLTTNFVIQGTNMVVNGDFSSGSSSWSLGNYDGAVSAGSITPGGEYLLSISNGGINNWSVQLLQAGIELLNGKDYLFEFDAYASATRTFDAKLEMNGSPYTNYSRTSTLQITTTKKHYSYPFKMLDPSDYGARVVFNCGLSNSAIYLDNISVKQVLPSGIDEANTSAKFINLEQNYPNPFNGSTKISYTLPVSQHIKVAVYDILGSKVAELVDGVQNSGYHSLIFPQSVSQRNSLVSGAYFYSLQTESGIVMKKLIYMK